MDSSIFLLSKKKKKKVNKNLTPSRLSTSQTSPERLLEKTKPIMSLTGWLVVKHVVTISKCIASGEMT